MPAAEGMFLEWMVEPRVGLLWDLDVVRCQLADMMKIHDLVAASGGVTAVARLPRIVTLWRLHMKSCYVAFPALANQLNAGRQIGGVGGRQAERQASRQAGKGGGRQAGGEAEEDCFGSILVQVLGVKGKKELESGLAAHVLPLVPGGRQAHGGMRAGTGRGGGVGGGIGWVEGGEEWREGLRGMEWDEYVERMEGWRLISTGAAADSAEETTRAHRGAGMLLVVLVVPPVAW
ncbi:unnamed protein product [Closterium sp. Naga37s-1]|nr:unnamed protein product [Closterium sp. Naga37s-1]